MEREFVITQRITLYQTSPFDGRTISELFRKPEVCYDLLVHYDADVIEYSITETTDPDAIASAVDGEVADAVGQTVVVNRRGNNGDNDRGYEVVSGNGKRCIVDIGVMRCHDSVWYVVAERGHVDYPIDSADDLRELLEV